MMKEGKKSLDYNSKVNAFVKKVKSRKVDGSFAAAMQTVTLLKRLIKETNWKTAQTLITILTTHGKTLTEALPVHASVGNMVRRVLKIVREEYTAARKNKQEEIDPQDSLHKIVTGEGDVDDYTIEVPELKSAILDHISEFQVELETSAENIANQGKEHIHSNEIIMTIGRSRTVEAYLKKAAEDRKFEVIVVECAPFCHVIVLAPLYKLSPQYLCSYAHETFNSFVSPEGVLHYSDGDILSSVHVYNPVFDYVPPELVTLFISNTGGHAPSYVYRLLSELYHPDDNF
ncbi:eukaryotic translation initiation factor 2B subunit beta isoform X2 [Lycorma delicatula]|uniref:eukaryotic translation initiation factor 2B subunit beta isoform X2 n=1 Tax=Lycorma delicatula TaxID=130591 RepID=UPI003F514213